MKNIVATIPKTKFKDWATAERVCKMCDGTTLHKHAGWPESEHEAEEEGSPWYWLINCVALPSKIGLGESVCFMVFDGQIRGYFDIVDTDTSENWRTKHPIGKKRTTECVVMANWHPIEPIAHTGFQGYRYTELRP